MKFEYLAVLLIAISVPFIKSFSKEINFYTGIKRLIYSLGFPFVTFVIIDIIAVKRDLWTFNSDYVLGFYFFGLPFEEVLFFLVVPFSCLFVWETVKYFTKNPEKK
jgi:lycopene cyclase domain-containing protein